MEDYEAQEVEFWRKLEEEDISRSSMLRRSAAAAFGLTAALELVRHARLLGLKIMAGCMVGTSLGMAPAMLLAQQADFVDLDGPLLLARDRVPGLRYEGSRVFPPARELWG